MKLDVLYDMHDNFEKALRNLERYHGGNRGTNFGLNDSYEHSLYGRLEKALWQAHDELERSVIIAQARQTEEELDNHGSE